MPKGKARVHIVCGHTHTPQYLIHFMTLAATTTASKRLTRQTTAANKLVYILLKHVVLFCSSYPTCPGPSKQKCAIVFPNNRELPLAPITTQIIRKRINDLKRTQERTQWTRQVNLFVHIVPIFKYRLHLFVHFISNIVYPACVQISQNSRTNELARATIAHVTCAW